MRSPYAKYQGGGPTLPAGYLEASMRPGQAIAAGIREASEGIAEGLQKYSENKEQGAFLDQRFENLKPYLDKILADENTGFAETHGKKIGLDLEKFSKSGLSAKKAMLADMEFLIQRYDADRDHGMKKSQADALKAYREATLGLQKKEAESLDEYREWQMGAGERAFLSDARDAAEDKASAERLAEAHRLLSADPPKFVPPGTLEKFGAKAALSKAQTPEEFQAIQKMIEDREEVEKEEGWNLTPGQTIPLGGGASLVALSRNHFQLVQQGGETKNLSPLVQANIATIASGSDDEFKALIGKNPGIALEATDLRRKINLANPRPPVDSNANWAAREIIEKQAELRRLEGMQRASVSPNPSLNARIKEIKAGIEDLEGVSQGTSSSNYRVVPGEGGAPTLVPRN